MRGLCFAFIYKRCCAVDPNSNGPVVPAAPPRVGPLGPHAQRECDGRGKAERCSLD